MTQAGNKGKYYCIIKQCARDALKDYGEPAYKVFIKANPKAKLSEKEKNGILAKRKKAL
jgi:hypothetical protein